MCTSLFVCVQVPRPLGVMCLSVICNCLPRSNLLSSAQGRIKDFLGGSTLQKGVDSLILPENFLILLIFLKIFHEYEIIMS